MPRLPVRNRSSVQAARRLHGESLRFDSTARLPPRHMHSGATKATRLSALPAAEAWEMKVCWVEFRSSLAAAITHRVRTPIQDPGASSQNPPAQPQARASRTSLVQRGSLPWSQWLRGFRTLGCSFTALTSWSFVMETLRLSLQTRTTRAESSDPTGSYRPGRQDAQKPEEVLLARTGKLRADDRPDRF